MMGYARATANSYQQTQVATADRGQLLLLVFDGGLKFLGLAERNLRAGDLAGFAANLARAQAVIAELMNTLDHERGGAVASNLERLYRFMLDHLIEANLTKSPRHVAQVARLLDIIAGAFREILRPGLPQVHAA